MYQNGIKYAEISRTVVIHRSIISRMLTKILGEIKEAAQ